MLTKNPLTLFLEIRQMVSPTFYSVPVLHQPSPREDLKNLKGYLWFLCRLVLESRLVFRWISVPVRVC
jgi:hypothetical protein